MNNCIDCGKELLNLNAKRCRKCHFKYAVGKNNSNFRHGKTFDNHCLDCGKLLGNYRSKRCKSCSRKGKLHWAFGRNVIHGKGAYYKNIWMRSSYEIAFAKYLDKVGIKWLYEPKAFDLGNTTYRPDFYIPKFNSFYEIKGYWRDDAKMKFELFKKLYPTHKIIILEKQDLIDLKILKKSC
ncbi:MAG: hypothetical protein KKA19_06290 [Candidatus Margulisbacteria bacterium]|nr:hypothetical protein [Candidatus Margulisiibacteriota bacterium]